jgi:predicted dehydrogenase
MEKVRIGIIGVGQIGKHHLREYAKIEGADVAAICDIDEAELGRVSQEFKIADTYTNFREMIRRPDLAAIDVCLHNNLHAPATIAALRAGKHVYCEKPMAGAYVDAKAMLDEAAKCGKMINIQLSTIFAKETKAAKRLIDDGRLGRIYHARSTGYRRRGRPFVDGYGTANFVKKDVAAGGALYDMGVYHISQILYLVGQPQVERISGKVYQETGMDSRRRESSGYSVEELGLGFVKCAGGLTIDIMESWAIHMNKFEGSSIAGSSGGVRLDPLGYFTTLGDMEGDMTFDLEKADLRWHRIVENTDAYDSPQHHWVAALGGRVPLLACARIALDTMLISEGIYLSDKLGREVSAEEVLAMSKSTAVTLGPDGRVVANRAGEQ